MDIVIAYEPIWALSSQQNQFPIPELNSEKIIISPDVQQNLRNDMVGAQEIQETHKMIRDFIEAEVGAEISKYLRIIYGGPVSKDNAERLIRMPDVDGFLVHDEPGLSEQFQTIVDEVDQHWRKGDDTDGRDRDGGPGGGGGGPAVIDDEETVDGDRTISTNEEGIVNGDGPANGE